MFPTFAWAQELTPHDLDEATQQQLDDTAEQKLDEKSDYRAFARKRIEGELKAADDQKTSGLLKMVLGTAISVGSVVAFFPSVKFETDANGNLSTEKSGNEGLYYTGLGLGSVVSIWGIYQFADGYSKEAALRYERMRIDLSLAPDRAVLALAF